MVQPYYSLPTFRFNLFNHPGAKPPPTSSRVAENFKLYIDQNLCHFRSEHLTDTTNPVPSAAAASFFQLLHTRPRGLNIKYSLSAPCITATLLVARSDYSPCCLVSGCEPLRFILWHVFNAKGSGYSPCGFEACARKCESVISDRMQFRLQSLFHRAASNAPVRHPPQLLNAPGNSALLNLPFDVLLRILCMLTVKDHAALGESHPYLRKFLASVVPGMKLRLYPHQISALYRMSEMEQDGISADMPLIHQFKVSDLQHGVIVADLFDGSIYELDSFPRVARPRGGLLCDEPGLGKTITTLSHILKTLGREPQPPANRKVSTFHHGDTKVSAYQERITTRFESLDTRRKSMSRIQRLLPNPQNGISMPKRRIQRPNFFQTGKGQGSLPMCGGTESIYLSRATLVIVPSVLTEHWMHQIDLHVKMEGLRVLRVHSQYDLPDTALELAANYDIIVVPFDIISGLHNQIRQGMPLLLKVHFYRVIVDEGHRISSSGISNFALGCDKIKADIRWVMTGTPTPYTPRTDVDHLYSLLTFIRDEAYGLDRDAWRAGIREPYMRYKTESLDRLSKLLESVMIRADKSILKAKCRVRNVFLNFSVETAESYNGLIRMGKRNLITSDWFDEGHEQSLLNKRNKAMAHTFVSNLRKACCFGGSMDVRFYGNDVVDMLILLRNDFRDRSHVREEECFRDPVSEADIDLDTAVEEGYEQAYVEDLRKRRELFAKIRSEGRSIMRVAKENRERIGGTRPEVICYIISGKLLKIARALTARSGKCSRCREEAYLPYVTPCAHLLCDECLVRDRTGCVVPGCKDKYEIGDNLEPKDLIELQPCLFSGGWRADWDQTVSAKMRYLVDKIEQLPLLEVWKEGCGEARMVRPKVLVHSEHTDHLKLAGLYLKDCESLKDAYIDIVRNEWDTSEFVKKCKSPAEYSRKAIRVFAENDEASILLMNSRLGGLGLDLSFVRYVFLLEPLWDSAQEMQITSRAHRIGCTGDIVVERLIMRGSIEEAMVKQLQGSASVVDEGSAAGVAAAKAEKDHMKRRNILMNMRLVKSMGDLSRVEAGIVAKVTETVAVGEEVVVMQTEGSVADWGCEGGGGADDEEVDVRRQVMATRERIREHRGSKMGAGQKRASESAGRGGGDDEVMVVSVSRRGAGVKRARKRVRFDDEDEVIDESE
eukprot:gb/GEZJ01004653.1/.p1 GENE.gb/GEZJ01004653.1/~~gb/GEZJ01004653.1/.p1  ORF type:complete len:1186 (-),score=140.48 gb/GEZJ01004653.1/:200-3712(-)